MNSLMFILAEWQFDPNPRSGSLVLKVILFLVINAVCKVIFKRNNK